MKLGNIELGRRSIRSVLEELDLAEIYKERIL